jgi:two-component system response regulator DesR
LGMHFDYAPGILATEMSMGGAQADRDLGATHSLESVRVLVVEVQKLFAEALKLILEASGMEVVGVTPLGEEALATARREKPDLVILDVNLSDMSGLVVGKQILQELPGTKIMVVTALASTQMVKQAFGMGFHGYLTMDTPILHFNSSLLKVLSGDRVLPTRFATATLPASPPDQPDPALAEQLSQREREILALLADGLSNAEIGRRLRISQNTVRTHAQNILTKLQVHSRLEAVAFAVRFGLVGQSGGYREYG